MTSHTTHPLCSTLDAANVRHIVLCETKISVSVEIDPENPPPSLTFPRNALQLVLQCVAARCNALFLLANNSFEAFRLLPYSSGCSFSKEAVHKSGTVFEHTIKGASDDTSDSKSVIPHREYRSDCEHANMVTFHVFLWNHSASAGTEVGPSPTGWRVQLCAATHISASVLILCEQSSQGCCRPTEAGDGWGASG